MEDRKLQDINGKKVKNKRRRITMWMNQKIQYYKDVNSQSCFNIIPPLSDIAVSKIHRVVLKVKVAKKISEITKLKYLLCKTS